MFHVANLTTSQLRAAKRSPQRLRRRIPCNSGRRRASALRENLLMAGRRALFCLYMPAPVIRAGCCWFVAGCIRRLLLAAAAGRCWTLLAVCWDVRWLDMRLQPVSRLLLVPSACPPWLELFICLRRGPPRGHRCCQSTGLRDHNGTVVTGEIAIALRAATRKP